MDKNKHEQNVQMIKKLYDKANTRGSDIDKCVEEVVIINNQYIEEFKAYLSSEGLSKKTINRSVSAIDFFANVYLTNYFLNDIFDGMNSYCDFFSYFLVHKCIFTSVSRVKEYISSLKKFYRFMFMNGYIEEKNIIESETLIKNFKDEWINETKMYNDYIDSEAYEDQDFNSYCITRNNEE